MRDGRVCWVHGVSGLHPVMEGRAKLSWLSSVFPPMATFPCCRHDDAPCEANCMFEIITVNHWSTLLAEARHTNDPTPLISHHTMML